MKSLTDENPWTTCAMLEIRIYNYSNNPLEIPIRIQEYQNKSYSVIHVGSVSKSSYLCLLHKSCKLANMLVPTLYIKHLPIFI
jgi:hypothetical protein